MKGKVEGACALRHQDTNTKFSFTPVETSLFICWVLYPSAEPRFDHHLSARIGDAKNAKHSNILNS